MHLSLEHIPIRIKAPRRAFLFQYLGILVLIAVTLWVGYRFGWNVLAAVPAILGVIWLVIIEIARFVNTLTVDRNKLVLSSGLLSVHTTTVYYDNITDIKISQNVWERLLRYGKVFVNTPGHGEYEIFIAHMPSPHQLRDFMERLEHAHALSRGAQQHLMRQKGRGAAAGAGPTRAGGQHGR